MYTHMSCRKRSREIPVPVFTTCMTVTLWHTSTCMYVVSMNMNKLVIYLRIHLENLFIFDIFWHCLCTITIYKVLSDYSDLSGTVVPHVHGRYVYRVPGIIYFYFPKFQICTKLPLAHCVPTALKNHKENNCRVSEYKSKKDHTKKNNQ